MGSKDFNLDLGKLRKMHNKTIEIRDIEYPRAQKYETVTASDIDAPRLAVEPKIRARLEKLGEKIRNRKARR